MEGVQDAVVEPGSRMARWTLVASILGSSMAFVDGSVVNVALHYVTLDLGGGSARAVILASDLGHDYVSINADYRS